MAQEETGCPVEATLALLGDKWKVLIIKQLLERTKRFGEVNKALTGISQKMLTQQLRQMEKDGLVKREVYAEVPPRVEYSLTEVGISLKPILEAMHRWGENYVSSKCRCMEELDAPSQVKR